MAEQRPKGFRSMLGPMKFLGPISVVGLLLGIGLCGVDAHFHPQAEFGGGPLAGVGAVLCVLSGLGLIATLLVVMIVALVSLFRH